MHHNNEDIVDRERFDATRKELGEGFARILTYYREDGAKIIADIQQAVRDRSAINLVRPAHTLKGDSLMLGAEALGVAAEEIEKAARLSIEMRDFPDDVMPKVRELGALFARTMAFFDRETAVRASPVPAMPAPRRAGGFGRRVIAP